jgi:hypothetical protein
MYVILTKNSNDTWDAISQTTLSEGTISKTILDSAFETGLPIVGMDVTPHKSKAKKESIWNGSSFSGGNSEADLPLDDDAIWATLKRYVFLCDNKVVFSMSVSNENSNSEMMSAAFAGETILVKTSSGPTNKVGKTFTWNGTDLTLVE